MSKKEKFIEILKKYGVTKCRVSEGFNFEEDEPDGAIRINVKSNKLENELYKLLTKDNGLCGEDQTLLIWYDDFSTITENISI